MIRINGVNSVVTPQELALLLQTETKGQSSGLDTGFKYRNGFLALATLLILTALLFFPKALASEFGLVLGLGDMSVYFQFRGILTVGFFTVYGMSYTKDWHFARVALVMATLSFADLVADIFLISRFTVGAMAPAVVIFMLIRVAVTYCLFINAVHDNRAPALPRTLFS